MIKYITQWAAILSIALMGVAVAAPASERGESTIDEHFLLLMGARNAVKAGKHETAIARYHKLLAQNPSLHDARRELGWVLIAAGKHQEAEEQFRTLVQANPRDTEGWKGLLEASRKSGKRDEALTALERLVELEPRRRDLRMQLALELHNRGRFAEAETHIAALLGE